MLFCNNGAKIENDRVINWEGAPIDLPLNEVPCEIICHLDMLIIHATLGKLNKIYIVKGRDTIVEGVSIGESGNIFESMAYNADLNRLVILLQKGKNSKEYSWYTLSLWGVVDFGGTIELLGSVKKLITCHSTLAIYTSEALQNYLYTLPITQEKNLLQPILVGKHEDKVIDGVVGAGDIVATLIQGKEDYKIAVTNALGETVASSGPLKLSTFSEDETPQCIFYCEDNIIVQTVSPSSDQNYLYGFDLKGVPSSQFLSSKNEGKNGFLLGTSGDVIVNVISQEIGLSFVLRNNLTQTYSLYLIDPYLLNLTPIPEMVFHEGYIPTKIIYCENLLVVQSLSFANSYAHILDINKALNATEFAAKVSTNSILAMAGSSESVVILDETNMVQSIGRNESKTIDSFIIASNDACHNIVCVGDRAALHAVNKATRENILYFSNGQHLLMGDADEQVIEIMSYIHDSTDFVAALIKQKNGSYKLKSWNADTLKLQEIQETANLLKKISAFKAGQLSDLVAMVNLLVSGNTEAEMDCYPVFQCLLSIFPNISIDNVESALKTVFKCEEVEEALKSTHRIQVKEKKKESIQFIQSSSFAEELKKSFQSTEHLISCDVNGDGIKEEIIIKRDLDEQYYAKIKIKSTSFNLRIGHPEDEYKGALICDFDGDGLNEVITVFSDPQHQWQFFLIKGTGAVNRLHPHKILEVADNQSFICFKNNNDLVYFIIQNLSHIAFPFHPRTLLSQGSHCEMSACRGTIFKLTLQEHTHFIDIKTGAVIKTFLKEDYLNNFSCNELLYILDTHYQLMIYNLNGQEILSHIIAQEMVEIDDSKKFVITYSLNNNEDYIVIVNQDGSLEFGDHTPLPGNYKKVLGCVDSIVIVSQEGHNPLRLSIYHTKSKTFKLASSNPHNKDQGELLGIWHGKGCILSLLKKDNDLETVLYDIITGEKLGAYLTQKCFSSLTNPDLCGEIKNPDTSGVYYYQNDEGCVFFAVDDLGLLIFGPLFTDAFEENFLGVLYQNNKFIIAFNVGGGRNKVYIVNDKGDLIVKGMILKSSRRSKDLMARWIGSLKG